MSKIYTRQIRNRITFLPKGFFGNNGTKSVYLILFFLLPYFSNAQLFSNPIKRSYALLNSGKFDQFSRTIKKYTHRHEPDEAVYYAYARFFFDEENKTYHIDSAKHYITLSINAFNSDIKQGRQKMYASLGIRLSHAKNLEKLINSAAFTRAENINTIEGWNFFINNYSNGAEYAVALTRRNKLAFDQAKDKYDLSSFEQFIKQYPNASEAGEARALYEELLYHSRTMDSSSQSYFNFIQQYPNSPYYKEAKNNYNRILYKEKTKDQQLSSYVTFVDQSPNSPYLSIAQDSIYLISTRVAIKKNFESFVKKFPSNPHAGDAWIKFFQLSLVPYCDSTIKSFKSNNPFFPYPGIIDKEEASLLPDLQGIEQNGAYGYINSAANKMAIPVQYDDANDFSEGLASVAKKINGKELYGYIDKSGEIKIPFIYPYAESFNNGFATVGNGNCDNDSCLYGVINRIGYLVLPMMYEEVFPFSNDRCLLRNDSLYGFVGPDFKVIIPFEYSDAFSFSDGFAAVANNMGWQFIDKDGRPLLNYYFLKATPFSEGLAAVEDENELWGYIDTVGDWVIKPQYLQAESFKDGKAKVFVPATKKKNAVKLPKEKYINKTGEFITE